MKNILFIEDSEELVDLLKFNFKSDDIKLDFAFSIKEANEKLFSKSYCLYIIDLKLPDGDGFEILSKIKKITQCKNIPIIFLTAENNIEKKIKAFQSGIDDYITKPFHIDELMARIFRNIEKYEIFKDRKEQIFIDIFELNNKNKYFKTINDSNPIYLTNKEFHLFHLFLCFPNTIFTRKELIKNIWGENVFVSNRTIDSHVCMLRKKLSTNAPCIESIKNKGYRYKS